MALSYRDAGVDLEQYAEAMNRLPEQMKRTFSPRVMALPGGFAGLFRLLGDGHQYEDPVLVSGADGVGTKLKVAQMTGRYSTVGIDLVAMCVNDCLCCGAEPLFFLDYLALPKDDPQLISQLVTGVADGCVEAEAALLGGETAIMPDLYRDGEYDMAGFCVGVVDREKLLDGSRIQPGDIVLGLPSTGFHSNGFSLIRKVVFEHAKLSPTETPAGFDSTIADLLLVPTKIYTKDLAPLRDQNIWPAVHGLAHITGGGLEENVTRLLPDQCEVQIDYSAWEQPHVFSWVQQLGEIEEAEMRRVFNLGIGMAAVVEAEKADLVRESLGDSVVTIGQITAKS